MSEPLLDGRVILHAGDSRDVLATQADAGRGQHRALFGSPNATRDDSVAIRRTPKSTAGARARSTPPSAPAPFGTD